MKVKWQKSIFAHFFPPVVIFLPNKCFLYGLRLLQCFLNTRIIKFRASFTQRVKCEISRLLQSRSSSWKTLSFSWLSTGAGFETWHLFVGCLIRSPPWKGCFPLIKEKPSSICFGSQQPNRVFIIQQRSVFLGSWRGQWFGTKLEFSLEVPKWKSNDFSRQW